MRNSALSLMFLNDFTFLIFFLYDMFIFHKILIIIKLSYFTKKLNSIYDYDPKSKRIKDYKIRNIGKIIYFFYLVMILPMPVIQTFVRLRHKD